MSDTTTFYLTLLAVNIASFLPLYLLNFQQQPNPVAFLTESRFFNKNKFKIFYSKHRFTDPFRLNFDYTFLVLLASAVGPAPVWANNIVGFILAVGTLEILYTITMQMVFRRAPAIASDLSLVRAGLKIAHANRYWIVPLAGLLVIALVWASIRLNAYLLGLAPADNNAAMIIALLLVPLSFYHWRSYNYSEFLSRTVYSPLLHFVRNIEMSRRFAPILAKQECYFERLNGFKSVQLKGAPNILIVCVESYGSVAFEDESIHDILQDTIDNASNRLGAKGLHVASNYSAAPIFSGGSWLSYASFTYGIHLADLQLYDGLFTQSDAFQSYESLFHVVKRNQYTNYLLCPLGGVDSRDVDWKSVNRCFQSDHSIDFAGLDYKGRCFEYFVQKDTYSAPDQYALNFAYDSALAGTSGPFSLFYCTLNSHYPWRSPIRAAADWTQLDDPTFAYEMATATAPLKSRYALAIRYQLEYLFEFLDRRSDDNLITVLFGDHQPPLITSEESGTQTPVHVFGRNEELIKSLENFGFVAGLDLRDKSIDPIQHAGFLSLFMNVLNTTYGTETTDTIEYMPRGAELFNDA